MPTIALVVINANDRNSKRYQKVQPKLSLTSHDLAKNSVFRSYDHQSYSLAL